MDPLLGVGSCFLEALFFPPLVYMICFNIIIIIFSWSPALVVFLDPPSVLELGWALLAQAIILHWWGLVLAFFFLSVI